MCVCVYVCMYVCVCVYVCVYLCVGRRRDPLSRSVKQQRQAALCEALLCFCIHSPDGAVSLHDVARRLQDQSKAPANVHLGPVGGGPGQGGPHAEQMEFDEMLDDLRYVCASVRRDLFIWQKRPVNIRIPQACQYW